MGATLRYAKVVDRESLLRSGGKIRPGLDSVVQLRSRAPSEAMPFSILRAWDDFDSFVETWRIADPEGRTVHDGIPREVMSEHGDLADDLEGVTFEYPADGYQLILEVDSREVARVAFPVREDEEDEAEAT